MVTGVHSGLTKEELKEHYKELAKENGITNQDKNIEATIDKLFEVITVENNIITIGDYNADEIKAVYQLLKAGEGADKNIPYRVTILYSGDTVDRAFKIAISKDGHLKIEEASNDVSGK